MAGGGGGSSLAGLQDHVKLARDYALEGLYDTSIIFFDGAVAQINRFFFFHCCKVCPFTSL